MPEQKAGGERAPAQAPRKADARGSSHWPLGTALSLYLFQVAAQKADWLSMRQTTLASNVANASTPGYRAMDLQPFSALLDSAPGGLASTNAADLEAPKPEADALRQVEEAPNEETLSGNTVNLEQEMVKLGNVTRDFSMTANIQRAFHQLLLSALK